MKKHIHVHIHTNDAGTAHDPDNGQFTTSGNAGGNAMHHHKQAQHHMAEKNRKGSAHEDFPHHALAMASHGQARNALEYAQSATGPEAKSQHMTAAQTHANSAAKHEAKIKGKAEKPPRSMESFNGKHTKPGGDHPDKIIVKGKGGHAEWMTMSRALGEHKVKEGSHEPVHHDVLNKRTIIR